MTEKVEVELNGENVYSIPSKLDDNLILIREKLKANFGDVFFLDLDGNQVDKEDENELTLKDILLDSNKIKIQSKEIKENSENNIEIVLNGENVSSKNYDKSQNLSDLRKLLENEIKDNFLFLDEDENEIAKDDEEGFKLEDIIKNNTIKLKSTSNNESNENIKANIDLSKCEELERKDDLIIYKYPINDIETINIPNPDKNSEEKEIPLIFKYNCDEFDINDEKLAYVIIFIGKTGDGKSNAINALFNIIKGIKLEDKYRIILIKEEKKEGGQAVSQTDGIHLYYIKDYNNHPIIIIDSQGYGDTRGIYKDLEIDEAFRVVFSNIIDHINAVGFISNATVNRLDIDTKYIFTSITKLFAGNINENFIILATHANYESMTEGPIFVESIQTDAECLKIEEKTKKGIKWWYAFDSKCILSNKIHELSNFSYSQLSDFYEEKVKKLEPKEIKQSLEVLNNRKELTIEINKLSNAFQDLLIEQNNLVDKENLISEKSYEIENINDEINTQNYLIENLNPEEINEELYELEYEVNSKINELSTETEIITRRELVHWSYKTTHCDYCKRNCHERCDCLFSGFADRCTIFSYNFFSENTCDKCGCKKSRHNQDYYHYDNIEISVNKDNSYKIQLEKRKRDIEKQRLERQLNEIKKKKNKANADLIRLYQRKQNLEMTKEGYLEEKELIIKENEIIKNKIQNIIFNIQMANQKLEDIAMNRSYMKILDEYIDNLTQKIDEVYGSRDKEKREKQLAKIKEIKNNIKKITNLLKLGGDINLNDSNILEKLKTILRN